MTRLHSKIKFFFFIAYFLSHFLYAQKQSAYFGYIRQEWNEEGELPENTVEEMMQSSDGYIWATTTEGAVRFNGYKFEIFDKSNIKALKNNAIYTLAEDHEGSIWMGTNGGGVVRLRRDGFSEYFSKENSALFSNVVRTIQCDKKNKIVWIGTEAGLNSYQDGKIFAQKVSAPRINALFLDSKDRLWVSLPSKGIDIIDNKGKLLKTIPNRDSGIKATIMEFEEDNKGRVWAATRAGLAVFKNDILDTLFTQENGGLKDHNSVYSLFFNKEKGEMWVGTMAKEMLVFKDYTHYKIFPSDPKFDITVNSILIDHEQNIWVGYYKAGIMRMQESKILTITEEEGLGDEMVKVVCVDNQGTLYAGTNNNGVTILKPNYAEVLNKEKGLSSNNINALCADSKGNLWVGTYHGFVNRVDAKGRIKVYDYKKGLNSDFTASLLENSKGKILVGSYGKGVYILDDKRDRFERLKNQNGDTILFQGIVRAMYQDRQQKVWFGTNEGFFILDSLGNLQSYTSKEVGKQLIGLGFHQSKDDDGVWIASRGSGLFYLKNDKLYNCKAQNGLFDDLVNSILEDNFGNLWLSCNKGIYSVPKKDILDFFAGKKAKISCTVYGKTDGMHSTQCNGGFSPAAARDAYGMMYFPTLRGVAVVDMKRLQRNIHQPPVYLQHIKVDDNTFILNSKDTTVIISDKIQRLDIFFSALSFRAPEKVKFKFKLEGFDKHWLEGKERMVYYTNLPYGKYTFRVVACNDDGVWNERGGSLKIVVLTPIWLRGWAVALEIVLFLVIVSLGVMGYIRWRLAQTENERLRLESLVNEKTREILKEKEEIERQRILTERANEHLTDSIRYARRIQNALLPTEDSITSAFSNSFVLFLPRDIVSGDFFWYADVHTPNPDNPQEMDFWRILIAADCTGHGVPGAFMTVVGNAILNEIINENHIIEPSEILSELDKKIIASFEKQTSEAINDGMDIAILSFNEKQNIVKFSGAKNPLLCVRNGEIYQVKGSKFPVGSKQYENKIFESHLLTIQPNDAFYIFSDGFQDQFGGENFRKYMVKNFRELILKASHLPLKEQEEFLLKEFLAWKGEHLQTDDVLVVGVKF